MVVTRASGDFGIDITMRDANGKKIGVQCKNWKGSVSFQDVWKTESGRKILHLDEAWIITSSSFTKNSYTAARELGIHLYDEQRLAGLIDEARRIYEIEQEELRKKEAARRAEEERRLAAEMAKRAEQERAAAEEALRRRRAAETHHVAAEQARRVEEERAAAEEAQRRRRAEEIHHIAAEQARRVTQERRQVAQAAQQAEISAIPALEELDRKFGAFEERRRLNAERVQSAFEERSRTENALMRALSQPVGKRKQDPAARFFRRAAIVFSCVVIGLLALFGLVTALVAIVSSNAG